MVRRVLFLIGLLILSIYIVPMATAKYAGSHTWERNTTGVDGAEPINQLRCTKCHDYITDEIGATALSQEVFTSHLAAASNSSYVGPNSPINLTVALPTIGIMKNVCMMCHLAERDSQAISGSHTKIIIRVCTDLDCHGDQSGTTSCTIFGGAGAGANSTCNVTGSLNSSTDSHSNFYRPLSQVTSTQRNEDGGFYDQGFYACMACHTHVGMDLEFTRPNQFILNMSYNTTDGWVLNSMTINDSSTNVSIGGKEPGSVW